MAAPTYWTDEKKKETIELIFDRISNGESVRSILDNADRKVYPSWVTFNVWLSENEELSKQYARACEMRSDLIFDEMIEIADDGTNDFTKKMIGDVEVEMLNTEHLQRSRLRIDTRKWILSKMNPKKYGEKLELDNKHSGEIKTTSLTKEERDARIIELKNKLNDRDK